MPIRKRKCKRNGSRTSGRADGKFRSRTFEYGSWTNCISRLDKITKSIQDGDFFENKALLAACENVKKNDSALHMMGLVSDGGVHSHNTHIYGLLELAKNRESRKFMYIVSLMEEIRLRHREKIMWQNWKLR